MITKKNLDRLSDEDLHRVLREARGELETLHAEQRALMERVRVVRQEEQALLSERYRRTEVDTSPEGIRALTKDAYDNEEAHKKMTRWAGSFDSHLSYSGVWSTKAMEAPSLQIRLDYREEVTDALVEALTRLVTILEAAWPQDEPRPFDHRVESDEPYYPISIFEHTLSAHGGYFLLVRPETGQALVLAHGYGSEPESAWTSLREALERIARDYWYQGGPDYSTDDDYPSPW